MANDWHEWNLDLINHDFEIYANCSATSCMPVYHSHPFYEIHIVLNGDIMRFTEDSMIELHPGAVSIYPPNVFHRVAPTAEGGTISDYSRILLYLSVEFLLSRDIKAFKLTDIFDRFGKPANRYLFLPLEELKAMCRPLQEIIRADRDDEPFPHLINSANVTIFLATLAEKLLQAESIILQPENATLIPRILTYINTHLADDLSLEHLSKQFHFDKYYISHKFKQFTQLSIHQYVLTQRMMHAQYLLRSGWSPPATAVASGYHEYSSFYKAFIRTTGQSPKLFSKKDFKA